MIFDQHNEGKIFYAELKAELFKMMQARSNIGGITGKPFEDGKLVGRWECIQSVMRMLQKEQEQLREAKKQEDENEEN
jgi:hypothetical protein